MENFLDSCVVIHYSNYLDDNSGEILKRCFDFVQKKTDKFILCYASLEELFRYQKDIKKIHKAVVTKMKNEKYNFSGDLDFRSVPKAKQLYALLKDKATINVSSYLQEQRENIIFKIEQFILNLLNEKVIPLANINNELVKKINDHIKNHADCKILASALQFQKDKDLFLFVTADKDFAPNDYQFLEEQFEINYPKENWKFPKLLNLIFTN